MQFVGRRHQVELGALVRSRTFKPNVQPWFNCVLWLVHHILSFSQVLAGTKQQQASAAKAQTFRFSDSSFCTGGVYESQALPKQCSGRRVLILGVNFHATRMLRGLAGGLHSRQHKTTILPTPTHARLKCDRCSPVPLFLFPSPPSGIPLLVLSPLGACFSVRDAEYLHLLGLLACALPAYPKMTQAASLSLKSTFHVFAQLLFDALRLRTVSKLTAWPSTGSVSEMPESRQQLLGLILAGMCRIAQTLQLLLHEHTACVVVMAL